MREGVTITPGARGVVRVVQVTDTHIAADPAADYDGVDTAATLRAVVAAVAALAPPPDLVLLTGDLADDPVHAAYERLVELLAPIRTPIFCIPGNHDNPPVLKACMNQGRISTLKRIDAGDWSILLLDTWLPATHGGRLSREELEFLREELEWTQDRHVLVALHHPPVSIRSPWMDGMALENPAEFFSVLDGFGQVRAVLWGHIHQAFESERRGVRLLGTPSTCVQFQPGATEYVKSGEAPGYRRLHLLADGGIDTAVVRVP